MIDDNFVFHGRQSPISHKKLRLRPTSSIVQPALTKNRHDRDQHLRKLAASLSEFSDKLFLDNENREHSRRQTEQAILKRNIDQLSGQLSEMNLSKRNHSPVSSRELDDLNRSIGRLRRKLHESTEGVERHVVDHKDKTRDEFDSDVEEELERLIAQDEFDENSRQQPNDDDLDVVDGPNILVGRPGRRGETEWFTSPVHRTNTSDPYSVWSDLELPRRSVSPTLRNSGELGASLAQSIANRRTRSGKRKARARRRIEWDDPHDLRDHQALAYFPVTLGDSFGAHLPGSTAPYSHDADIYTQLPTSSDVKRHRQNDMPTGEELGDELVCASPYQLRLAQLRMDQLRLQEEKLLEVKRMEELERIRGPKPKWYESKKPDFHYEAHKNNELLRNTKNWSKLWTYRNELLRASREFSGIHS